MNTAIDQYELETTWSNRATDEIVQKSIEGEIPIDIELSLRCVLQETNPGKLTDSVVFIKVFSLILANKAGKPIQAIATQLGFVVGIDSAVEAFEWGLTFIKSCQNSGLYTLVKKEAEWYVVPSFSFDKQTLRKLEELQFLPPMQILPNPWASNYGGGWVWEKKHLVLGSRFTKHDMPLAYDVINTMQEIAWEIDPATYLLEKQTNHGLNKKKFLRVIYKYIGKAFHFVWQYDSRGRSYSSGYHLNIQSNEYGKALLSFHDKEVITNPDNLAISIANHAGMDNLTWEERIAWTRSQDLNDPNIEWDQPMLGRKALRAAQDTLEGKPTGYLMSIDATSSGLQIMAVLSGCKKTAELVNCVDSTVRQDVYTTVAHLMNDELPQPVARKTTKQAAMTHYYNSKATPKALFSETELRVFYEVLDGLLPGAEAIMELINACWSTNKDYHSWTLPDGHVAYVPVIEGINAEYLDSDFGEIPIRYYTQTPSENYRSLCPNIMHSVDGYVAREMIRRCSFQLIHVHDCFFFNPNYLQDVANTYKIILAEIARSDLLQDILRQITGDNSIRITKFSSDLDKDILQSSYMLS